MAKLKATVSVESIPEKCRAKYCGHPPLDQVGEPMETSLCPGFSVMVSLYECPECETSYQYKLKRTVKKK